MIHRALNELTGIPIKWWVLFHEPWAGSASITPSCDAESREPIRRVEIPNSQTADTKQ
jgi:hypothetical protein